MSNTESISITRSSSSGDTHSGVITISYTLVGDEVLASVTPRYDSMSNSENATSTGTSLVDALATTGVIHHDGVTSFFVADSSGASLAEVAAKLITKINLLGGDCWEASFTSSSRDQFFP